MTTVCGTLLRKQEFIMLPIRMIIILKLPLPSVSGVIPSGALGEPQSLFGEKTSLLLLDLENRAA
jgi:hypothetical protein